MKYSKILALFVLISVVLVFSGIAQQKTDETVTCPVSGEVMKKADAKISYDYKGKTYYFCCEGCKEKFIKDPGKYLQAKPEVKDVYTCPMHPEVKSDKPGKCPNCGMNLEKKEMVSSGGMPMEKPMHGQMQSKMQGCKHGEMMAGGKGCCAEGCLMNSKDVEVKSEKLSDGISVTITSKNAEVVKKIQEYFADMKAMCGEGCYKKEDIKKEETKKD